MRASRSPLAITSPQRCRNFPARPVASGGEAHTVGVVNDLSTRDREYVGDFDDEFDAPDDDLDADYDDYDYLPPAGRRWHPVAVIAGGVLIAAVVATVGIVNSDDSGTKSATVGPPPRTAVAAPTTAPAAPEPPSGSRAPETVTTVPPGPTPSRQPHAEIGRAHV